MTPERLAEIRATIEMGFQDSGYVSERTFYDVDELLAEIDALTREREKLRAENARLAARLGSRSGGEPNPAP